MLALSTLSDLVTVDSRCGMVVLPVKPVIPQYGHPLQALALIRPGNGATPEVPFAAGRAVYQEPIVHSCFAEEFQIRLRTCLALAQERSNGFSVRPYNN